MSVKVTDVAKKAKDIAPKLKDNLFLGGDRPSAADVQAFNELLGAGNLALFRWVKHMASFTDAERAAWPAPPAKKTAASKGSAAAKPAPTAAAAAPAAKPAAAADDDDVDLFGEETEEEKALLEKKKAADKAKTAAKPAGKSSILIDIKPWDDTVDLEALWGKLKAIERDGLTWGSHKLAPVAFGVKKLVILITIVDDKISGDDIEDIITGFEDEVQSMDIQAWNKV